MSGTTLTTCQYLANLDQAYIAVVSGNNVRSVTDQNGEVVSYSQSNATMLLDLIRRLAPACPSYQPIALGATPCLYPRPLRPFF